MGAGDPFFTSTALEPQDSSNPIEQHLYKAIWARVTAAITSPGVKGQEVADKPISFSGYFDTNKNTQINRPLTFNKYNDEAERELAQDPTSMRGEAGITSISITQKSFFVNQIEIAWSCPDPIEFEERIEPTFLRHGQVVAIEFGYGLNDKELDYQASEITSDEMAALLSDNYKRNLARAGSYCCEVGTVSNYKYELGADGSYTGTITLHSRGQNVLNETIQNEDDASEETPAQLTPTIASEALKVREAAKGTKNIDGTFDKLPKPDAARTLRQLKKTEATYKSVVRNLDKVIDYYIQADTYVDPINWGQLNTMAAVAAGGGAVVGGIAGAGLFSIPGAAIGATVGAASIYAGRFNKWARQSFVKYWQNGELREHYDISMAGYLEGLGDFNFLDSLPTQLGGGGIETGKIRTNAGDIKLWAKNGIMKFTVHNDAISANALMEVPEGLKDRYLISWGWFEDHILGSYFNIKFKTRTGHQKNNEEEYFQEVRSVDTVEFIQRYAKETNKPEESDTGLKPSVEADIPNICHLSKDVYTLGLDSVVLPGRTHPNVKKTFAEMPDDKKLLASMIYDKKTRIELARVRAVYDYIDKSFQPFVVAQNGSDEYGSIRNMVFPIEMFQKHFENMNSLQQGMRSFWADVGNMYGGFWSFNIAQDPKKTGRVMVYDNLVPPPIPKPAEPKKHSRREDFIDYNELKNGEARPQSLFVFPLYSKNSIVKSFDLSVNISSQAATIANYATNTSIAGSVTKEGNQDLQLKAYAALLSSDKKNSNTGGSGKGDNDNVPLLKEFIFPIDNEDGIGLGTHPDDYTSENLWHAGKALSDYGIAFPDVKSIGEDLKQIDEDIELERNEFVGGIGIYDKNGNFSTYFKKRMKYLINNGLEENSDSNIKKRQVIIPIQISMTLDGVGGLLPGDLFKVDYLPKIYRKHTYFQVSNVGHTVGTSGWETKIEAMMRLDMATFTEDPDNEEIIKPPLTEDEKWNITQLLTGEEFLIQSAIEVVEAKIDMFDRKIKAAKERLKVRDPERARDLATEKGSDDFKIEVSEAEIEKMKADFGLQGEEFFSAEGWAAIKESLQTSRQYVRFWIKEVTEEYKKLKGETLTEKRQNAGAFVVDDIYRNFDMDDVVTSVEAEKKAIIEKIIQELDELIVNRNTLMQVKGNYVGLESNDDKPITDGHKNNKDKNSNPSDNSGKPDSFKGGFDFNQSKMDMR